MLLTLDAVSGTEKLNLVKELKGLRESLVTAASGVEKLGLVKRVKEIRVIIFGVNQKDNGDFINKALGIEPADESDEGLLIEYGFKKSKSKSGSARNAWIKNNAELDISLDVFKIGGRYIAGKKSLKTGKDGRDIASGENLLDVLESVKYQYPSMFEDQSEPNTTIADVNAVMPLLKQFIGKSQLSVMGAGVRGEEGQFFKDKFVEVAKVIEGMPKTYGTDGQGDKAIAYLHYFKGGADWYITEKDSDTDSEGQIQAFGYADLGQGGGELGYISIKELIGMNVELDLHWSPKSIGAIKGKVDDPEPVKKGLSNLQKMKDAIISNGGEVLQELSDTAVSFMLHGGEFYGDQPPYLRVNESGRFAVVYTIEDDPVFMSFEEDSFTAISNYVELYEQSKKSESMTNTDQQNPLKSAFIAELENLKTETDIYAFNDKLDEIAARVEQAGMMEELDPELNAAADVLTDLLAAAENS